MRGHFAMWLPRGAVDARKQFEDFKGGPPESLPRTQSHQWEWIEACKGNRKTFSSFDMGGPLTEPLGPAFSRTQSRRKLSP